VVVEGTVIDNLQRGNHNNNHNGERHVRNKRETKENYQTRQKALSGYHAVQRSVSKDNAKQQPG
jgi:hypothetical protein